ncbi:unnamed protein product [Mytilus edulis]|uniref:Uncharacterized protein n=1 Tax=Mytilus edulis TaxID=6550 RepID=A0A8S3UT44_MYTED|nr:unnamed protein product [Mytilus edulis]
MSETKLVKFLQTARKPLAGTQQLTPAILSDSKGSYLRDQVVNKSDRNIIWWCKGGATIDDRYHWLKSNIVKKIEQLGNISVYIFLGTCNLTSKNKTGEITLTSQQEHFTDEIISKLGQFVTLFKKYPSSKLTILEIPVYSITEWNRDLQNIHNIISSSTSNNTKLNIDDLNAMLREQLTSILNANQMKYEEVNSQNTQDKDSDNIACIKCTRKCRTKSTFTARQATTGFTTDVKTLHRRT